jgi:hypothetical protein
MAGPPLLDIPLELRESANPPRLLAWREISTHECVNEFLLGILEAIGETHFVSIARSNMWLSARGQRWCSPQCRFAAWVVWQVEVRIRDERAQDQGPGRP